MSTKTTPAAKKAAKPAAKKTAPAKIPKNKASDFPAPAKKVAPAKKAVAAKPVATKKAAVVGKSQPAASGKATGAKPTPTHASSEQTKASPAVISPAVTPGERLTKNGVKHPAAGGIGGSIWAIIDGLHSTLGRCPARFEVRELTEKGFDANSISFNYFQWRKFHGFKKNAAGVFPKRGTFELSVPIVRTPRVKKDKPAVATKAPKPGKSAPLALKPAVVAKKSGKKPAPVKADPTGKVETPFAPTPAKKAAKKPAPVKQTELALESPPASPKSVKASSRLKKLSEAASKLPTPPDCVIPPVEEPAAV